MNPFYDSREHLKILQSTMPLNEGTEGSIAFPADTTEKAIIPSVNGILLDPDYG